MRTEIAKLYKKLDTTFIYVTHDQTEAMTLGTRIVVMKDGVIQQVATPKEIYENPANMFVATFIGSPQINIVKGKLYEKYGKLCIEILNRKVILPSKIASKIKLSSIDNNEVLVGIRPEHISCIKTDIINGTVIFESEIDITENLGSETYIYLKEKEESIVIKTKTQENIKREGTLNYTIDLDKIHIFNKETEVTIV